MLIHPRHAARLAATAGQDAATLAKLLTASSDSRTVLTDPLHGTRRVAWSKPFRLDRVKRAGQRSSATINDVLVAALTGALHRYLAERDSAVDELHVMVPFNLRPLDKPLPRELGNDFGLILLALPGRDRGSGRAAARSEDADGRDQELARGPDRVRDARARSA